MEYATTGAIFSSNRIGLNLSLGSWREIFLAITDRIVSDNRAMGVTAEFVGNVRDGGERWHIKTPNRTFDVVYDPRVAKIILVIRPPSEPQPAVVPKPKAPLRGNVAERILADA